MRINHNLMALNTYNALTKNENATSKVLQSLSSGYRINSAADDAAGLAISEKMRGQINGLDQASRNAQDGISLLQTGEGALNETSSILQRMRELAVQASNGTYTTGDRTKIQGEMNQLVKEIDRIASQTQFNGMNLLGKTGVTVKLQIGANSGQTLTVNLVKANASALKVNTANVNVTIVSTISTVIGNITCAINTVSKDRSDFGAYQNRLEHTINNLNTSNENLTAAESRIRDVDMAKAMMTYTKDNILQQAAQSMLAQANQAPQGVLQLLR